MSHNYTVEISETSIHRYFIRDARSAEEAEDIAQQRFDDDDRAEEVELLDVEVESFESEEE